MRLVKDWMKNEEFRVVAVCQFLPVQGRTLWFAKNQLVILSIQVLFCSPVYYKFLSFIFRILSELI